MKLNFLKKHKYCMYRVELWKKSSWGKTRSMYILDGDGTSYHAHLSASTHSLPPSLSLSLSLSTYCFCRLAIITTDAETKGVLEMPNHTAKKQRHLEVHLIHLRVNVTNHKIKRGPELNKLCQDWHRACKEQ